VIDKGEQSIPEIVTQVFRANADEIVDVSKKLIVPATAGTGAGAGDSRVDDARSRRNLGPEDPGQSFRKSLCRHHGTTVPEGMNKIEVEFAVHDNGKKH
jgi:hypothetical protein